MTKTESIISAVALVAVAAVVVYYETSGSKTVAITPNPVPENCITISRDEIVNSWLDKGWNIPDDPNYLSKIMFEVVSKDPMVVVAYPVDKDCKVIEGKKLNMTIGRACTFPPDLPLGKARYDFVPSDTDAFQDLVYFNFLRIIPQKDPAEPTRLSFKVQFIRSEKGVERAIDRADAKPCPPLCPVQ